jgi:hypothetical protein
METESENVITFLDVLVVREDTTLSHHQPTLANA